MINIESQQIDILTVSMREQANGALAVYARKRFPRKFESCPDSDLRDLAARVRSTAKGYGIERENDVATFLDFTVMYGEDFPRAPWATTVLNNKSMHGPDKMSLLRYQVRLSGVDL